MGDDRMRSGKDSEQVGGRLAEILTTPGLKQADLLSQLERPDPAAAAGRRNRRRSSIRPGPSTPRTSRPSRRSQLRVNGMQGLADAFRQTAAKTDSVQAGSMLATQAGACSRATSCGPTCSRRPARDELRESQRHRCRGVPRRCSSPIPTSTSAKSLTLVWKRVHGASTGGTPSVCTARTSSRSRCEPAGTIAEHARTRRPFTSPPSSLRRRGQGRRRQPGGPGPGQADDSRPAQHHRQGRDDRSHRPGSDEDRHLQELQHAPDRRAAAREGRREACEGRAEHANNTYEYPILTTI